MKKEMGAKHCWTNLFFSSFLSESLLLSQQNVPNKTLQFFQSMKLKLYMRMMLCSICVFFMIAAIFMACSNYKHLHASFQVCEATVTLEEYHDQFPKMVSNESIAEHLRELTQGPHLAGTPENFATADYVFSAFEIAGLDTHFTDYEVLLSYPLSRSLSLSLPGQQNTYFSLKEKAIDSDPFTHNTSRVVPSFHAYSPSANVSGPVVYANYGRQQDFAQLREMGIDVWGAIVIAKYGKTFRGDIVDNAAKAGAVGVVIYSDPRDFGGNRTEGYYPYSQWLPPTGIQRGTAYTKLGDPLTPGWPSIPGSEKISDDDLRASLPRIPSIPISAEDATTIFKSLDGPVAPAEWHGALDLPVYRLGRGQAVLNLHYKGNMSVVPIRNVFGIILGSEEPDRYVLLGNHRDAWTFGAGDPNSGTAILLEIANNFGKLLKQGWQPRRSIIFCNWDAEEYSLIGSTEWVEQNFDLLFSEAVAYINVDTAVMGPGFFASSTPQLDEFIYEITKKIEDPDSPDNTIYQTSLDPDNISSPGIGRLGGAGSDYASFLQHVGVPVIDIRFGNGFPVYHSIYDDYNWMAKFGDPLFHRHVALGGIWGLIALNLADCKILPFSYVTYADTLQLYVETLEAQLGVAGAPSNVTADPVHKSIVQLRKAALQVRKEEENVNEDLKILKVRNLNDRLLRGERAFTDPEGLPEKSWYKHLIYGPSGENKYGTLSFPGVTALIATAMDDEIKQTRSNVWSNVQHEIWKISRAISRVALVLRGNFT